MVKIWMQETHFFHGKIWVSQLPQLHQFSSFICWNFHFLSYPSCHINSNMYGKEKFEFPNHLSYDNFQDFCWCWHFQFLNYPSYPSCHINSNMYGYPVIQLPQLHQFSRFFFVFFFFFSNSPIPKLLMLPQLSHKL